MGTPRTTFHDSPSGDDEGDGDWPGDFDCSGHWSGNIDGREPGGGTGTLSDRHCLTDYPRQQRLRRCLLSGSAMASGVRLS